MPKTSIYDMPFEKVYSLLVQKAERKGRTQEEVDEVIRWLCGYDDLSGVQEGTYGDFIRNAPAWNPASELITGSICGVKVEMIEDPDMKRVRQLDKLIDELAKGRPMEKILRRQR
ncbi:MAG: DUF2200 domain-containing protein [Solobacterium sp.]|nr:DUF2200 domain-containing protein [Solobacterium sp.]